MAENTAHTLYVVSHQTNEWNSKPTLVTPNRKIAIIVAGMWIGWYDSKGSFEELSDDHVVPAGLMKNPVTDADSFSALTDDELSGLRLHCLLYGYEHFSLSLKEWQGMSRQEYENFLKWSTRLYQSYASEAWRE